MTQSNLENTLRNLMLHADDPDIETRNQYDEADRSNPHIAPGWNALTGATKPLPKVRRR